VVPDAPLVAERVARRLRGRLVRLHEAPDASRVILRDGRRQQVLDFSSPQGGSLRADLRGRDFTINALAAGPLGRHPRLADPCGGRADLARRVLRMTSADALAADPVRVVRTYRFASALGFRPEGATRRACRRLASLIGTTAPERVGRELLLLAGGRAFGPALRSMAADGVLLSVLPGFAAMEGCEQGGVHQFDVAQHSLLAVTRLAEILRRPARFLPAYADCIAQYLAHEGRRAGLVLAVLLHDVGKPGCRVWSDGRWRFFGHEERGARLAEQAMARLALPRAVRRQVVQLVGSHMRLLPFMQTDSPTPRARRRLMRDLAPHGVGAVLLALADRRALRAEPEFDDDEASLRRLALLLSAGEEQPAARSHDLPLNGRDLLALGLPAGPRLGEALRALEAEWLAGRLATRDEALAWAARRAEGQGCLAGGANARAACGVSAQSTREDADP
jgi:tRNA nucleotidyltransferase/poly(A) polymerase